MAVPGVSMRRERVRCRELRPVLAIQASRDFAVP
jgi:hypothetical protein